MEKKTVYCPKFKHFKDTLVCRLNCPGSRRCRVFQEYLRTDGAELSARLDAYLALHPGRYDRNFYLEVIRVVKEEIYLAIDTTGKPVLLKKEEILQRAEKGERFPNIYKISHEMELRYQLVPKQAKQPRRKADRPAAPKA
jgi:hypothetical protein